MKSNKLEMGGGGVYFSISSPLRQLYARVMELYPLTHWYQPIYRLESWTVLGYEALLRPLVQPEATPMLLFNEAQRQGHRAALDCLSLCKAWETAQFSSVYLFVNVFPNTLLEPDFLEWWDEHIPSSPSLVLELSEQEAVTDWAALRDVVGALRRRGVQFAIDDIGVGYASLRYWLELEPEFVKLDRYFTYRLAHDARKQRVVGGILYMLDGTPTQLILEGLEEPEDLAAAKYLGVPLGQGFLLGHPVPFSGFGRRKTRPG